MSHFPKCDLTFINKLYIHVLPNAVAAVYCVSELVYAASTPLPKVFYMLFHSSEFE